MVKVNFDAVDILTGVRLLIICKVPFERSPFSAFNQKCNTL